MADSLADNQSYIRFSDKESGQVLVANFRLPGKAQTRANYEFGAGGISFATKNEAARARQAALDILEREEGRNSPNFKLMSKTKPAKTQSGFDSSETLFTFKETAKKFIREHVEKFNPVKSVGEARKADENKFWVEKRRIRETQEHFSRSDS